MRFFLLLSIWVWICTFPAIAKDCDEQKAEELPFFVSEIVSRTIPHALLASPQYLSFTGAFIQGHTAHSIFYLGKEEDTVFGLHLRDLKKGADHLLKELLRAEMAQLALNPKGVDLSLLLIPYYNFQTPPPRALKALHMRNAAPLGYRLRLESDPDQNTVATHSSNMSLKRYAAPNYIKQFAFSADGQRQGILSVEGLRFRDPKTDTETGAFIKGEITAFAFMPGASAVVICINETPEFASNYNFQIRDIVTGKILKRFDSHQVNPTYKIFISPDGEIMISVHRSSVKEEGVYWQEALAWDTLKGELLTSLGKFDVEPLFYFPNDKRVVAAVVKNSMKTTSGIYSLENGNKILNLITGGHRVLEVALPSNRENSSVLLLTHPKDIAPTQNTIFRKGKFEAWDIENAVATLKLP